MIFIGEGMLIESHVSRRLKWINIRNKGWRKGITSFSLSNPLRDLVYEEI